MPVKIIEVKQQRKGALLGFVKIQLGSSLRINDCPVLQSGDHCWVALPGKPRLGRDGRQAVGSNGKPEWLPVLEWSNRAASDRFSASVVDAIAAFDPEFFAEVAGDAKSE